MSKRKDSNSAALSLLLIIGFFLVLSYLKTRPPHIRCIITAKLTQPPRSHMTQSSIFLFNLFRYVHSLCFGIASDLVFEMGIAAMSSVLENVEAVLKDDDGEPGDKDEQDEEGDCEGQEFEEADINLGIVESNAGLACCIAIGRRFNCTEMRTTEVYAWCRL